MSERDTPAQSPLGWVLLVIGLLGIALAAWHHWPHQGDDGYIFFRHAERLLDAEWGWTDGVPPLEGYSSPLWLLLLTVLSGAGISTPLAAKILGAASLVALLAGMSALVRELGGAIATLGYCFIILAVLRPGFYWAFAGLETPLAAAALMWTGWGVARGERRWALPTGILGLVRPEGPALALAAVTIGCLRERRLPSIKSLLLALGPAAAWLILRLVIYGDLLPNTFYAKAAGEPLAQVIRGIEYAGLLIPMIGFVAIFLLLDRKRPSMVAATAVLALAATQLAVVVAGGGDWMWFGRLLVPVFPLVVVLIAWAATGPRPVRILAWVLPLGLFTWVMPAGTWSNILSLQPIETVTWQEGEMTLAEAQAGRWLASNAKPDDLIAVNHAGALPWAAPDQRFLDMTGLLDRHIATQATGGLHKKYDVDHVLTQRPAFVVLHTRTQPSERGAIIKADYWVGETALLKDSRFQATYEPTGQVWPWDWVVEGTSWTVIYRRKSGV